MRRNKGTSEIQVSEIKKSWSAAAVVACTVLVIRCLAPNGSVYDGALATSKNVEQVRQALVERGESPLEVVVHTCEIDNEYF